MFKSSRLGRSALLAAFSLVCIAFSPAVAQAQDTFQLGTGGTGGAYFTFGQELSGQCGQEVGFTAALQESGTPGNVSDMLANQKPWGMGQLDWLVFEGMSQDLSRIKVLAPLFPEQVLFIIKSDLVTKDTSVQGKMLGWIGMNKGAPLIDITSLAGLPVVSFGGAHATASLIRLQGGVAYNLLPPKTSFKEAWDSVQSGQAAAMVAVQGFKNGNFRGLPDAELAKVRFLPIPPQVANQFKSYRPAKASYPKMAPVQTIEVMSALLTYDYQKGSMAARTKALQECLYRVSDDMASTPGKSPAWRNVKDKDTELAWPRWNPPAAVKAGKK